MFFRKHYPELDLVRALAITMVLLFHVQSEVFNLPADSYLTRIFAWGYHGVDLFFVLSGFLIGGQLIEDNLAGSFSFKRFYLKRFWRIMPPYYAAIAAAVVFYSVSLGELALRLDNVRNDIVTHVFYLQDYIRPVIYSGLYWSLAVEEQFYIIAPVLLYLAVRYAKRFVLPALTALTVFGVALRFVVYDPSKEWWATIYLPFHARFDSLLMGVVAAYLFIRFKDRLAGLSYLWKVVWLSVPAASLWVCFTYGSFASGYFNSCWQFTLAGLGFAALILYMAANSSASSLPLQGPVSLVARYSYTMYLYHKMLLIIMVNLIVQYASVDNTNFTNFFIIFFIYFIVVFAASAIIYMLIDRPCMNMRKRTVPDGAPT